MQPTDFEEFCFHSHLVQTTFKLGFPCGSAGKESACNAGDLGLIPGLGRYPREGKGYPLQYSGLENSMDCIMHGVAKSQIRLSHFHFTFKFLLRFLLWPTCYLEMCFLISMYSGIFQVTFWKKKKKLLISSLIQCLRPDTALFLSNLLNCVLCPRMWPVLVNVPCESENNVYSAVAGWSCL